jgi:hypothetical protein
MLTMVFSLSVLDSDGETEADLNRDDESGETAPRRPCGNRSSIGDDDELAPVTTVAGQATATTMVSTEPAAHSHHSLEHQRNCRRHLQHGSLFLSLSVREECQSCDKQTVESSPHIWC